MLAKRIIACLDVKDGRTVKGVNFINLRDAGDAVQLAAAYSAQGADEIVFLDISATHEGRGTMADFAARAAENINIPFTIGGGISEIADVEKLLAAGADKISVNSAALKRPALITEIAKNFGSQVCVCAVDAKEEDGKWFCYASGGRVKTDKNLFDWAMQAQDLGAGEILFTSMNHDGVKTGFAVETLAKLADILKIPLIASGGAGKMKDFKDALTTGRADAALAAGVFHFGEIKIPELKKYLKENGIPVR